MLEDDLNRTVDIWILTLNKHEFKILLSHPISGSWSLGQLFMHLIEETEYYIQQVETCLLSQENADQDMTPEGKVIFAANALPDIKIKRSGDMSNVYPDPKNKEETIFKMEELKERLNSLSVITRIEESVGKTKHPGLGYFNAEEWLQFADIHLRHHLRQKKRLEDLMGLS